MDGDYTQTVDLNGDGKDETIVIEALMHNGGENEEMRSDAASGFVITDDNELIVKYYIEGKYGHVDCLGYGLLHLTLNKDNTWNVEPEFVLDSD